MTDLSLKSESFGVDDQSWLGSRHGVGNGQSITLDSSAFTKSVHYPDGYVRSGTPLGKITATGKYGPYASPTSEVQTVTITGGPTGGTFTLTFSGQTTAPIAHNATSAAVKAALEALSNIDPGDVAVAGGPGPATAWAVTFAGQYRGENVAQMTAAGSFTGGTSPAVAVATGNGGGTATGSDGTEVLAGLLLFPVSIPTDTTHDVSGALLWHGRVVEAKLPVPVDDAAIAAIAGRIVFV